MKESSWGEERDYTAPRANHPIATAASYHAGIGAADHYPDIQTPRSKYMLYPYYVALWGTFGGTSCAFPCFRIPLHELRPLEERALMVTAC